MAQCRDCGKTTKGHGKRCRSCAVKARWVRGDFDGILDSPERRYKQSETTKAAWVRGDFDSVFDNPEICRKRSENTKAAWIRGAYEGVHNSIEICRKKSKNAKAAWARGDFDDPETRHKMTANMNARWQDPKYRQSQSGENNPNWQGGKVKLICEQCKEAFEAYLSDNQRFCSPKCKGLWWSENVCGENHWNWQGGASFEPYGPEWTDRLKEAVRERDNHTCAISGDIWQVGQDRFHVHHIDYDKMNNNPDNLITLNHNSHARTNTNRPHWLPLLAPIARGAEMRTGAFVQLEGE